MSIEVQFDQAFFGPGGILLTGNSPVDPLDIPYSIRILENAANAALGAAGESLPQAQERALTLVVSGDEALRALNLQFLGIDEPTDVLSFPGGEVDPDEDVLYLGDVIISFPAASRQAAAAGYPVTSELQLLVVHGVLHLLGYDHLDPQEKARMWSLQDEVLSAINCPARPDW